MKRIHIHWTAGGHKANPTDTAHYHFIVEGDGNIVRGDKTPEANLNTADGHYAAHTRAANTGAIGVAFAAMRGAVERPFDAGPSPITQAQLDAMASLCADLCDGYGIPVTRATVLTHAEVEPTLGVKQRGKWDVCWIPGMAGPGDAVMVGDRLREMVEAEQRGYAGKVQSPVPDGVKVALDDADKKPVKSKTTWAAVIAGATSAVQALSSVDWRVQVAAVVAVVLCVFIIYDRDRKSRLARRVKDEFGL